MTATPSPQQTIRAILALATDFLKKRGVETPRLDAEILFSHALEFSRVQLYTRLDQPLNQDEIASFRELIRRRAAREPVAYITGKKEFWSLELAATPDVLIPRPETERLVEACLEVLLPGSRARVLDMGTGSGAIILALAKERPGLVCHAADISVKALDVARQNAARLGLSSNINFFESDWFCGLTPGSRYGVIVSNPPYVRGLDIAGLAPEISHEPRMALNGGADGLDCFRRIILEAPGFLEQKGWLMLECGHDQKPGITAIAGQAGAYEPPDFLLDYAKNIRVARLRKKA